MQKLEMEMLEQLAEELAARGVQAGEEREWWEVGCTDDEPISQPDARAPRHIRRGWRRPRRSKRAARSGAS